MSGFNTKEVNNNGDYEITFYTENREDFKKVQSLCRELIGNGKPISTEGGLISRSEAEKLGATCLAKRNENGQLEAIISLDNAPTVEAYSEEDMLNATANGYDIARRLYERQQGEWIECTKSGMPLTEYGRMTGEKWYGFKCSRCNFIYKGNALIESPFCQKCGADMREGSTV